MSTAERSIAEAEFARRCDACVLRISREQELQNRVEELEHLIKVLELQLEEATWR